MSMSGFFPKITLPTRLSETTCTLIDNVITNDIDNNHLSGVLIRKISDHQMNFCIINDKRTVSNSKGKFIEVENNTGNALENFQNYFFEKNIIPEKIVYNDKTLTNEQEIANSFNSFFASVDAQLSSSVEQSDNIPSYETYLDSNTRLDPNFHFIPVDERLV